MPGLGVMTMMRSSGVTPRFERGLGGELGLDGFGKRGEGGVGLEAGDVEGVEATVAEAGADLFGEGAALRAAEPAGLGDDEAEDGKFLLDLQLLAQFGGEFAGEIGEGGQAHVGLVDAVCGWPRRRSSGRTAE